MVDGNAWLLTVLFVFVYRCGQNFLFRLFASFSDSTVMSSCWRMLNGFDGAEVCANGRFVS